MYIVRQYLKVSTILRSWALNVRLQTYGKSKSTLQIINQLRESGSSSTQLEGFLISLTLVRQYIDDTHLSKLSLATWLFPLSLTMFYFTQKFLHTYSPSCLETTKITIELQLCFQLPPCALRGSKAASS